MARDPIKQRRRIEAVAAIIGQSQGFVVYPGHNEGEFPIQAMAEAKQVGDRYIQANPRARAFVKTAREIIARLNKRDLQ